MANAEVDLTTWEMMRFAKDMAIKGKSRLRKKIKRSSNPRKKIGPRRINPSTNHLCWRPQQTRGAKKNFMTSLLNSSIKALRKH
jgi:hypothetical protein